MLTYCHRCQGYLVSRCLIKTTDTIVIDTCYIETKHRSLTGYRWFELSSYQKLWLTRTDLLKFVLLYSHESHSKSCKIQLGSTCHPVAQWQCACFFRAEGPGFEDSSGRFISLFHYDQSKELRGVDNGVPQLPQTQSESFDYSIIYPDFCQHACWHTADILTKKGDVIKLFECFKKYN